MAKRDDELSKALRQANIETPEDLDALLERACGHVINGLMVVSHGRDASGQKIWQIVKVGKQVIAPH